MLRIYSRIQKSITIFEQVPINKKVTKFTFETAIKTRECPHKKFFELCREAVKMSFRSKTRKKRSFFTRRIITCHQNQFSEVSKV